MTQWTPELEQKIKKFADNAEKQMKTYLNPRTTVAGTFLRIAFREKSVVLPAYRAVCEGMGITLGDRKSRATGYLKNMQAMLEIAQQNGSHVADNLANVIEAEQKIDAVADRKADPFKAAKKVKQANIQL